MLNRLAPAVTALIIALPCFAPGAAALPAPPANDAFAFPHILPFTGGAATLNVTSASLEGGETPTKGAGNDWAWTTWYFFQLPAGALAEVPTRVDLCGTDPLTEPESNTSYLSVFRGSDTINATPFASSATGCPNKGGHANVPRITYTAVPGSSYRFAVGAQSAATGNVTLDVRTAPVPTGTNTVSGTVAAGSTLTSTAPTWTGLGTQGPVTWQRCNPTGTGCFDIAGASAATYVIGSIDAGYKLRSVRSATNEYGTTTLHSMQTTIVPESMIEEVDTDGDGTPDSADLDDDNDGLPDLVEMAYGFNPLVKDTKGDGVSDDKEACTKFGICTTLDPSAKVIVATSKQAVVLGTSGNDILLAAPSAAAGSTSRTVICNGLGGNDVCVGGAMRDSCVAGAGNDVCIGGKGKDSCTSTSGKDNCSGGAGNDLCVTKGGLMSVAPATSCNGGTGNDTCTATEVAPTDGTERGGTKSTMKTSCTGGAGNDMCKVATGSGDNPNMSSVLRCSGGLGADVCAADNALTWALGQLDPVQAKMVCYGGPGSDLLLSLNGVGGDVLNGGGGGDICIADLGDTVTNCGTTLQVDLRGAMRDLQNAQTGDAAIKAAKQQAELHQNGKPVSSAELGRFLDATQSVQSGLSTAWDVYAGTLNALGFASF